MSLEGLVFLTQAKENRVLQVAWQNDALVTSLARHLHAQVPWHESNEGESWGVVRISVLGDQMLLGEGGEGFDGITKVARVADMLPGQCRERCTERCDGRVDRLGEDAVGAELEDGQQQVDN